MDRQRESDRDPPRGNRASILARRHRKIRFFLSHAFFFLSGILFAAKEGERFPAFLKKKARSLLVPYFCFAIAAYLYWLLVSRNFGSYKSTDINTLKPLVGILYSNGVDDWLVQDIPLWFLTCLFIVEMAFYSIKKLPRKWIVLIALSLISVVGYALSLSDFVRLPWGINVALTGIVFYGIGSLLRDSAFDSIDKKVAVAGIPVLVLMTALTTAINSKVDMNLNLYGDYFLFYAGAMAGICSIIFVSVLIPENFVCDYLSSNTLQIMALHLPMLGPAKLIMGKAFRITAPPIETLPSVFYNLLFTIVILSLLIPVMFVIDRYLPFVLGRRRRRAASPRCRSPIRARGRGDSRPSDVE